MHCFLANWFLRFAGKQEGCSYLESSIQVNLVPWERPTWKHIYAQVWQGSLPQHGVLLDGRFTDTACGQGTIWVLPSWGSTTAICTGILWPWTCRNDFYRAGPEEDKSTCVWTQRLLSRLWALNGITTMSPILHPMPEIPIPKGKAGRLEGILERGTSNGCLTMNAGPC